jgi:hypothetical protein
LILGLTAVNPPAVALTQATPGNDGVAQAVVVTSRSLTVTRAWNVVVDVLPFLRSDIE